MTAPLPETGERRNGGRRNALHRFVVRWWAQVILTTAGLAAAFVLSVVRGVFATPGKLEALTVQVDTLAKRQERQGEDLKDIAGATWTFVALQCLSLSDSSFVSSKLPCGKAFLISGVARRVAQ